MRAHRPATAVDRITTALDVLTALVADAEDVALDVAHAQASALAVVEQDGVPLIISADVGGALRSWRVDGTPGPLNVPDAHDGAIWALAVVEQDGVPLIISASADSGRALRSWRVDGTPGPLNVTDAHHRTIWALAVVENDGAPLIISADIDGALRSWRVAKTFAALQSPCASELKVRELSLGSLEIVVHLPIEILAPVAVGAAGVTVMKLAKILDAIKRMAPFAPEVRLQRTDLDAQQLQAETRVLEAKDQLAAAQARHHERQLQFAGWELERAVLTDSEDQDVL